MENFHPNQHHGVHQEIWRSTYMTQQKNNKNRKGSFTKALAGRHYEDGGLENAKRRENAEKRQQKRLQTLEEHTKNVAKLQEEALEVQAQLEEIQHRNRLKAERAARRARRHEMFCAARSIQNVWRCNMAGYTVETARRGKASTTVQRMWRGSVERRRINTAVRTLSKWINKTITSRRRERASILVQSTARRSLAIRRARLLRRDQRLFTIQEESAVKVQAAARGHQARARVRERATVKTFVTSMCDSVFDQCGVRGINQIVRHDTEMADIADMSSMDFEFSAPTALMPKLSLSALPKNGQTYHEEFMSHSNEFSKSWREQLEVDESRFDAATNTTKMQQEEDGSSLTARTDGGTVVETIRNLRRQKQHRRPQSSPVKRTTGPVATKPFRPAPRRRRFVPKPQQDEIMETRKAAMRRVAELEEKRMRAVRRRAARTASSRKKAEEDAIARKLEEQQREEAEKKEREWRFKEGMSELRESLKQSVAREKKIKALKKKRLLEEERIRKADEVATRQLYEQNEAKRKMWIKKQSERRAIREILEEKLATEAREREMEEKRIREESRRQKEGEQRQKRKESAARKEKKRQELYKMAEQEKLLKSQLRTAELEKKASVAMKKVQERLIQKKKEDVQLVKRIKKEKREREKELRRLKKTAQQRRQLSMAQQVPQLKTLHPDKKRSRRKKRTASSNKRSNVSMGQRRRVEFEELSLLSARSSPSRMSRQHGDEGGRGGGGDSVLARAMRDAQLGERMGRRSAPTSPRDDDEEGGNMMMPYPRRDRFHRRAFEDDHSGADALLELDQIDPFYVARARGGRGEERQMEDVDVHVVDDDDGSVVDALPVRRNGESVDDYIARATRMLEQQAFDEM